MAFTIPDAANAGNVAQAGWDSVDIDALVAADAGNFVESGCAVAQRGAGANMSVDVALGVIRNSGTTTKISVSATNKVITTADATNGRIDIVTASSAGALTVTAGTPAVAADATHNGPICPAIPAGDVLLAAVYVGAGVTSIVTANIIDKRVGGPVRDCQVFTSNGTWTKPANATTVQVICIASGSGGGSGAHITSGTAMSGGAGGGGGGYSAAQFPASTLGSTETVVVGATANGGAAKVSGDGSVAGAIGTAGNTSSFGTTVRVQATGGTGGAGGQSAATATAGNAGGGLLGGIGVGGANGISAAAGSTANPATTTSGATGAGSGGGLAATPAALTGGAGGISAVGWGTLAGGTAGAVGGTAGTGTSAPANMPIPGTGGGGGASAASGTAHDGGDGGTYGGAGGGGGSAIATGQSGKGGNGAAGIVVVYSW